MTYYSVYLDLGDHHWDIESNPTPGPLTDDLLVLDGLRFGWSMPQGLWPQQPDPMVAAVAVNVPDARDIADLAEGDPVAIEVTLHPDDTEPTFAFYGRITDLQATPRGGDRTGVTLSVVAVDYTTDMAEVTFVSTVATTSSVVDVLENVWDDGGLGDFPTFPTLFGFSDLDLIGTDDILTAQQIVTQQLLQTIGFSGFSPARRIILAPNIDPITRRPTTSQPWMFDVVSKFAEVAEFEIPSSAVELDSARWRFQKGTGPTRVEATGPWIPLDFVYAEHSGVTRHVTERVSTTLQHDTDGQAVADFYLPTDEVSRWQLDTFRYLLTRAEDDDDDLEAFYQGLMPYHTGPTGDPDGRAACYGHPIAVTNIPAHLVPIDIDGAGEEITVFGRLCGVELTISGRHVALDIQLRQTTIEDVIGP